MQRLLLCLILGSVFLTTTAAPLFAAGFTVNSTADTQDLSPGDGTCKDFSGNCSLRAAVMEANALADGVVIYLPAGTYSFTSLANPFEDDAANGDLDIKSTLTIVGQGATTIIDAAARDRVIQIHAGANLNLQKLQVTGGDTSGYAADERVGGGILNQGVLHLSQVTIAANHANHGGGLYAAANSLTTGDRLAITDNTTFSGGYGGGLYLYGAGAPTVTLSRALIDDNNAAVSGLGGGIYNGGNGSYVSPDGGQLTLTNTTVSNNHAMSGAGMLIDGGSRTYVVNCTIAYNVNHSSYVGAGIYGNVAASYDLLNTLVAGNSNDYGISNVYNVDESTAPDFPDWPYFDRKVAYGYNLLGNSPPVNLLLSATLTTDEALGGAGTYQLIRGSVAIDAGDPDPENAPGVDVFGTRRPQDGDVYGGAFVDIGAHEFESVPNIAPASPVPVRPTSGTTIAGSMVTLSWLPSDDPNNDDVTYRVEMAKDAYYVDGYSAYVVDADGGLLLSGCGGAALLLSWLLGYGRERRRPMLIAAGVLLLTSLLPACGGGGGGDGGGDDDDGPQAISFTITGLNSGVTYYWRVTAIDEKGKESTPSNTWTFTTQ